MKGLTQLIYTSILLFYLSTVVQAQSLQCPSDTTISCSVLIDPDFTGVPDSEGLDTLFFEDNTIQSCPDDIIISRSWIAVIDSVRMDTCVQLITIEVETIENLVSTDTLRIDDTCTEQLDELIQSALDLPCNLGIDSVDIEIIEESCERTIVAATWLFGDQCRDTSVQINQIVIFDNKQVSYLDDPLITADTGQASGAITLVNQCITEMDEISYAWSDGSTMQNLTDVPGGDYSVTLTNNDNCVQVENFNIEFIGLNDSMMMDSTGMMMDSIDLVVIDTSNLDSVFTISITDRNQEALSVDSIFFRDIDNNNVFLPLSSEESGLYVYSSNETILEVQEVCVELEDEPARDVSVQDIRIGQLLVLQQIEGCIEDRISGDVNGNNEVSGADLVSMRNIVLQNAMAYPIGVTWRFVRVDITTTTNELCVPVTNSDKNNGSLEVLGIKVGDLQCNE